MALWLSVRTSSLQEHGLSSLAYSSGKQSQRVLRVSGRKQISIVGIVLLFLSPTWHDEVSTAGSYCYGLGKYPPYRSQTLLIGPFGTGSRAFRGT